MHPSIHLYSISPGSRKLNPVRESIIHPTLHKPSGSFGLEMNAYHVCRFQASLGEKSVWWYERRERTSCSAPNQDLLRWPLFNLADARSYSAPVKSTFLLLYHNQFNYIINLIRWGRKADDLWRLRRNQSYTRQKLIPAFAHLRHLSIISGNIGDCSWAVQYLLMTPIKVLPYPHHDHTTW